MRIALFGGIYPNNISHKDEIEKSAVYRALQQRNAKIYVHKNFCNVLPASLQEELKAAGTVFEQIPKVDMALSVGGDGTFLRTATAVADSDIPILGINTGRLGFLADVNFNDLNTTMDEIIAGDYLIEERTLLTMKSSDETTVCGTRNCALNEIAILKQDTASMLTIHTYIDDEFLTTYEADGLIIATPTGSTAYSLSIGGPILTPKIPSFVLAPIAPHNLTSRPLVIHDQSHLRLEIESRSDSFLTSLDGQSHVFDTSVTIEIFKANYTLKVVKRKGHPFYETLRDKLMWGVDVRK